MVKQWKKIISTTKQNPAAYVRDKPTFNQGVWSHAILHNALKLHQQNELHKKKGGWNNSESGTLSLTHIATRKADVVVPRSRQTHKEDPISMKVQVKELWS